MMRAGTHKFRRKGVLTFEWILILTLMVIGLAGGLTIVRDTYLVRAAQTAEGVMRFDTSYHVTEPITCKQTFKYSYTNPEIGEPTTESIDIQSYGAEGSTYVDSTAKVDKPLVTLKQPTEETGE